MSFIKKSVCSVPYYLFVAVFCSFFFLQTAQHRVLLYVTIVFSFFIYKKDIWLAAHVFFKEFKILLVFLLYAFLTCLYLSIGDLYLVGETLRLIIIPLSFIMACAAIFNSQERWALMFNFFLGAATVSAVIAIIQFYYIDGNNILNLQGRRYEGFGRLMNSNIAGYFYGLSIMLTITQIEDIKDFVRCVTKSKWSAHTIIFALILLYSIALFSTGSRNAILATILSIVSLLVFKKRYKALLMLIILTITTLFIAMGNFNMGASLIERGSSYRVEIWLQAVEYFKQRPIFGHGYSTSLNYTIQDVPDYRTDSAHNLILGILTQTGIIGVILFLIFAVNFFIKMLKFSMSNNKYIILMIFVYSVFFSTFEMNTIFVNLNYQYIGIFIPISYMLSCRIILHSRDHILER